MSRTQTAEPPSTRTRRPLIPRSFIEAERRRRLAAAVVELVDEFGVREVTVTLLCRLAGCSRSTFYELFRSGEDCMRFALAEGFELLFAGTIAALDDEGDWGTRVAAATEALFAGAAARPPLARFTLAHSAALPRHPGQLDGEAGIAALAALLARRFPGRPPAGLREEFVARLHVGLLRRRLAQDDLASIPRLSAELAWAIDLLTVA